MAEVGLRDTQHSLYQMLLILLDSFPRKVSVDLNTASSKKVRPPTHEDGYCQSDRKQVLTRMRRKAALLPRWRVSCWCSQCGNQCGGSAEIKHNYSVAQQFHHWAYIHRHQKQDLEDVSVCPCSQCITCNS